VSGGLGGPADQAVFAALCSHADAARGFSSVLAERRPEPERAARCQALLS
jgi:hypothetical protein